MSLNISKLENVVRLAGGAIKARCPACAEMNEDKTGNHLFIKSSGEYGCGKYQQNEEHRKAIYRIVGKYASNLTAQVEEPEYKRPDVDVELYLSQDNLDRLIPIHDFFIGRGISHETLDFFRGGIATTDGKMKGRYVFPIFNEEGKIHGVSGRALWKPIDGDKDFIKWKHMGRKTSWVYPLYLNRAEIIAAKSVILVESIGDMLALWDVGIKNVLVVFGVEISQDLMARLIGLDLKQIIISLNNDGHGVGQRASAKMANKLSKFYDEGVVKIHLPPKKDWGDCTPEERLKFKEES